ncbi:MAG: Uma2 family endonuclease [Spirochaetes bacterium]|jgi:Uma2 family endonuclease|nr:Uma2 family endonuclease [Spirochaetota bacterium]
MSEKRYTYSDYRQLPDDARYEIIEGELFVATPAPSRHHQAVVGEVFRQLANQLLAHRCEAYVAPFDVMLPAPDEDLEDSATVVQPDVVVVCDPQKLDARGCVGPPDLAVEVVSRESRRQDAVRKRALYERHGVREYWMVEPARRALTQLALDPATGTYREHDSADGAGGDVGAGGARGPHAGALESTALPGVILDLSTVFPQ